jgi:hypothetical protein
MTTAFQADTFQNDAFQIDGAASSALRFNSSLNGLSVSGPFFADRLAVDFEEELASRFRGFIVSALRVGLPHEA